jgi:hypothetical protein
MLSGLGDNMQSDSDEWQRWFDSEMPELAKIPGDYQKVLTDFDRLILLRAMRPDRVTTALKSWIEGMMGKEYVFQDPFDMVATFAETSSETPTFFVLFAGVSASLVCHSLPRSLCLHCPPFCSPPKKRLASSPATPPAESNSNKEHSFDLIFCLFFVLGLLSGRSDSLGGEPRQRERNDSRER